MKAFAIGEYQTGTLQRLELPDPSPPPSGQVQLSMLGTSLNPFDQKMAQGYGAPLFNRKQRFPIILGRDAVASVTAIGKDVTGLEVGQRVLVASSARTGGTYADAFNLPTKCLAPIEDSRLTDAVAAGLGYAGLTAIQALDAVGLTATSAEGSRLCINGASGGVGSIALVLASSWGAKVTATASAQHHDWVTSLAECAVIDYRDRRAFDQIEAEKVVNFASDASPEIENRLINILRHRNMSGRAYATSVTPLLSEVTDKGLARGLLSGGATLARKRIHYQRKGIRYRWVLFKDNAAQLAELARLFSQIPGTNIIGRKSPISALEPAFNQHTQIKHQGKSVFLEGAF